MTTVEHAPPQCPSCGQSDAVDLSDGSWLCLQCRNEWVPGAPDTSRPSGAPASPDDFTLSPTLRAIFDAPDAAAILAAPSEHGYDDTPDVKRERTGAPDWSGLFVRYERMGIVCLVVEDNGKSRILIADNDGHEYRVNRSSCVLLGDSLADFAQPPTTGDDSADNDAPMVGTILATAGVTLTVALDALDAAGEGEPANPRIGWLPPPCNDVPEVEQGVAYAAILLITTWGIDREEVRKLAANLLAGAGTTTGTENTE